MTQVSSQPFSINVQGPTGAPAYIASMAPFEIKTLTNVQNGLATFEQFGNATYTTFPRDWFSRSPSGSFQAISTELWWDAWNGGFGTGADSGTHVMAFQGGGHNDGGMNAIVGFDFNGDTQARGYIEIAPASNVDDYIDCSPNGRYADGKPGSFHTYFNGITLPGPRYFRTRGARACQSGGAFSGTEIYDLASGSWVTPSPPASQVLGAALSTAYDPTTNKVLIYEGNGFRHQFYRVDTNDWSSLKFKSGRDPNTQFGTFALDPVRRTANPNITYLYLFGGPQPHQVWEIDWVNETIADSGSFTFSGTVGIANGAFYDELLDVLWVFGADDANFGSIYRISGLSTPNSLSITEHSFLSGGMGIIGSNVNSGFFNRFIWMPDWRAVGFAGAHNQPAQVIKLPSS